MDEQQEKKPQVFLVDDDEFLANMYATKFKGADISLVVFKGGVELLEKLKQGEVPSIIILDIVLPNMNGIEILKKIREEKLAEGVPVVMLTNQNEEKDISQSKILGIEKYIVKASATPSEVVETVKDIINKK